MFSRSAVELPYITVGSGSLSAMAMFEGKFRTDMEEEEAKKLVSEARAAGTLSDLGSGSNIDLSVISKSKLDSLHQYLAPKKKRGRCGQYGCEKGPLQACSALETEALQETVPTVDTS